MKIRNGFVSNSSSSSFVCEVCGAEESGFDLCLGDVGMCSCVNGHTICEGHKLYVEYKTKLESILAEILSNIEEYKDSGYTYYLDKYSKYKEVISGYLNGDESLEGEVEDVVSKIEEDRGISTSECPICSLGVMTPSDALAYVTVLFNLKTEQEMREHLVSKFGSYGNFKKYLKEGTK